MPKYVVTSGILVKDSKDYYKGKEVDLTKKEAESVTNVKLKEVQEKVEAVEKGDKELKDLNVDELEAIVEADGLVVEGSGADGKVLKKDLIKTIEDSRTQ